MKFLKKFIVFFSLFILLVVVSAISWFFGTQTSDELLYQDSHQISELITATAELRKNHPFFAEYDRNVMVNSNGRGSRVVLGADTGGNPDIRVYRDEGKIIFVSQSLRWYTFDEDSGEIDIVFKGWENHKPESYLGKFHLDNSNFRVFRWVHAKNGEYENPYVYKNP